LYCSGGGLVGGWGRDKGIKVLKRILCSFLNEFFISFEFEGDFTDRFALKSLPFF
jgi:hypothetical protein